MQPRARNDPNRSSPSLFCVRGLDDPYISIASLRRRRDARTRALRLRPSSDFAGSWMRVSMTRRPIASASRDLESTCPAGDVENAVSSPARFPGIDGLASIYLRRIFENNCTRVSRATCAQAQRANIWMARAPSPRLEPRFGQFRILDAFCTNVLFARLRVTGPRLLRGQGFRGRNRIAGLAVNARSILINTCEILAFVIINSLIINLLDFKDICV